MRLTLTLTTVLAATLAAATPANAVCNPPCTLYCVSPEPVGPLSTCDLSVCPVVYETLAEALAAAQATGSGSETEVCLLDSGAPLGTPHIESTVFDNTGGQLGSSLTVRFNERPLCPDPGSAVDQPVIEGLTDGPFLTLLGAEVDLSPTGPCSTRDRPGIGLSGGGPAAVADSTVDGASGYGVASGLNGLPVLLTLQGSRVANTAGPAVHVTGPTGLLDSEISGNLVDGATGGEAVIWAEAPGIIELRDSVVFGNVADGDAGASALILGTNYVLGSALVGNAVSGGIPVLSVQYAPLAYTWDGVSVSWDGFGVLNSVFSRNRQVASLSGYTMVPVEPGDAWPAFSIRCTGDFATTPYHLLAGAGESLAPGVGPLVAVTADALPSLAETVILRNFFVANETGGEPVIVADGGAIGLVHQFMHNTVADNSAEQLFVVEGSVLAESMLVAARNLLATGPITSLPQFEIGGAPDSVIVTFNAGPAGTNWVGGSPGAVADLVGPQLEIPTLDFEDPTAVRALSACDRYALVAPTTTFTTCASMASANDPLECSLDEADAWIPTQTFVEALAPWGWDTDFFDIGLTSWEADTVGSSGWDPVTARGTIEFIGLGPFGDLDWFPDAVDCDNFDATTFPNVPSFDGLASPYCEAEPGTCYLCPPGTVPPPPGGDDDDDSGDDDGFGGDDDDSGAVDDDDSSADDDDSAVTDDDDSAVTDDDDSGHGDDDDSDGDDDDDVIDDDDVDDDETGEVGGDDDSVGEDWGEGCGVGGCGFSWSCDEAQPVSLLLVLVPMLSRRRRQSAPSSEE